jgi:hypothetical protein
MATRSYIGYVTEEGKVNYIYCHYDGRHNGEILAKHYNSSDQAAALIALGNISFLEKYIAPQQELAPCYFEWIEGDVKHSFETPHQDVTVAYHRDRGQKLELYTDESEQEYWDNQDTPFAFLFKDGCWYENGKKISEPEPIQVETKPYKDVTKPQTERIIDVIERYGWIDGAHHKQWVLDQIMRICFACPTKLVKAHINGNEAKYKDGKTYTYLELDTNEAYDKWAAAYTDEDGNEYGAWDEGIAP